jgi:ferredoxin
MTAHHLGEETDMKVAIDQDKCVGSGQRVLVAPEVFDQHDEDGIAFVLQESPSDEQHDAVRQAAMLCPAMAIDVEEFVYLPQLGEDNVY